MNHCADAAAGLQVFQIKEETENKDIQYPSYYLKPFHAYEHGNLDWTAAFENESATSAMAWRVFKDPALSAAEAEVMMRNSIFQCLEVSTHSAAGFVSQLSAIQILGLSVKSSSHWLNGGRAINLAFIAENL